VSRRGQVEEFYALLDEVADRCGGPRTLGDCHGRMGWPRRGVYFFFEPGEAREDGTRPRVVRVGTHGLRPSSSTLWRRLSQHRGHTAGRSPGGGNHRGSVFRLHVGEALLAGGSYPSVISETWGRGSTAAPEVRVLERPLERDVSSYIRPMQILWIAVDDPPDAASERGVIERGAISLLSNYARSPIDPPSPAWLGRRAARSTIRESGLWNVNHVRDVASDQLMDTLRKNLDKSNR
jgi:hypothetical protein